MIFKNIKQQVKETLSQKKDAVIESLKEDIIGKPKPNSKPAQKVNLSDIVGMPQWERKALPRNDDYAIAAFVYLSKEKGMNLRNNIDDYPRFLSYEYEVNDPVKSHRWVLSEGYLEKTEPTVILESLKVEALKEILRVHGLEPKGKKAELITRIIENVDIDALNLEPLYVPSEKGLLHLKKYEYVFRLREYGITWQDYDNFSKARQDYLTPNDNIWGLLSYWFNEYNLNGNFYDASNVIINKGKLLEYEGKYLVDALYQYILALYYQTSGCVSDDVFDIDEARITPRLTNMIYRLKEYYKPELVQRCQGFYPLPFHALGIKNFERLILDIFEDRPRDIQNYIKGRK